MKLTNLKKFANRSRVRRGGSRSGKPIGVVADNDNDNNSASLACSRRILDLSGGSNKKIIRERYIMAIKHPPIG